MKKILNIVLAIFLLGTSMVKAQPEKFMQYNLRVHYFSIMSDSLQGLPLDTFPVRAVFQNLHWVAMKGDSIYAWSIVQQKWILAGGGTAVLGTGAANRMAYWSAAHTLTSTSNFTYDANLAVLTGQTTGTVGSGVFAVHNKQKNQPWLRTVGVYADSMLSGQRAFFMLGKNTGTNYNEGQWGYYYIGSGNDSNYMSFGFWGNEDLANLRANGEFTVGLGANTWTGSKFSVGGDMSLSGMPHSTTAASKVAVQDGLTFKVKYRTTDEILADGVAITPYFKNPSGFNDLLPSEAFTGTLATREYLQSQIDLLLFNSHWIDTTTGMHYDQDTLKQFRWDLHHNGYSDSSEYPKLNPAGGTTGQVLTKNSNTSYDYGWTTVSGGGVSDGDKGDITVSSSGTVWTIDNNTITLAKFQTIATASVLGRNTAGTGNVEVLTTLPNAVQDNITRLGTIATYVDFNGAGGAGSLYSATFEKRIEMKTPGQYAIAFNNAGSNFGYIGLLSDDIVISTGGSAQQVGRFFNTGILQLGVAGTIKGQLDLAGPTSGIVSIKTVAAAGTWTLTLPTTGGTSGYFLQTDGSGGTTWAAASGGGVSDGDKGDITVSSSGTVWTIDNSTITYAKMQNASAGYMIMAKATTGSGVYAELAAGTDGVLRRSGSGDLAFGTIVTGNIGNSQVTFGKIQNVSAGYGMANNGISAAAPFEVGIWMSLISGATTGAATIDIDLSNYYNVYDEIQITFTDLRPATDNVSVYCRISSDGSTYASGGTDYKYQVGYAVGGAAGGIESTGAAQILLGNNVSNTSTWMNGLDMTIYKPGQSSLKPKCKFTWGYSNNAGTTQNVTTLTYGIRDNAQVVRGVRFLTSSGNIIGTYVVKGIKYPAP